MVDVRIDSIGGNCPVQAEGTFDGEPFYFRARGARWSLGVGGEPVGDPSWETSEDYPGGEFAAGWMDEAEAEAFISKAADAWAVRTP